MSFFKGLEEGAKKLADKAMQTGTKIVAEVGDKAIQLSKTELTKYITGLESLTQEQKKSLDEKITKCNIKLDNIKNVLKEIMSMDIKNIKIENIDNLLDKLCDKTGGHYYKKYLKYKHKYLNLKAQLNL